jgi:Flp pilus assembly protein TadG
MKCLDVHAQIVQLRDFAATISEGVKLWLLEERGAAIAEIAIMSPLLILLTLGGVDFGGAVNTATKLNSAARAGAQYGAAHPADTCGIVAAVKNATTNNTTGLTIYVGTATIADATTKTDLSSSCSSSTAPAAYYCTCAPNASATTSSSLVIDCLTGGPCTPSYKNYYVAVSVQQTYTPTLSVTRLPVIGSTGISTAIQLAGAATVQFQ